MIDWLVSIQRPSMVEISFFFLRLFGTFLGLTRLVLSEGDASSFFLGLLLFLSGVATEDFFLTLLPREAAVILVATLSPSEDVVFDFFGDVDFLTFFARDDDFDALSGDPSEVDPSSQLLSGEGFFLDLFDFLCCLSE